MHETAAGAIKGKPSPAATPLENWSKSQSCVESGQFLEEFHLAVTGNERTSFNAPGDIFLSWAPMTSSITHIM